LLGLGNCSECTTLLSPQVVWATWPKSQCRETPLPQIVIGIDTQVPVSIYDECPKFCGVLIGHLLRFRIIFATFCPQNGMISEMNKWPVIAPNIYTYLYVV
jgi:hypothetical protein